MGPSCLWIGASQFLPRAANGHLHLPPQLLFGIYLLVAFGLILAVAGICVGIYRGLWAVQRSPRSANDMHRSPPTMR